MSNYSSGPTSARKRKSDGMREGPAASAQLVALEQQLALAEATQRVLELGAEAVDLTLNEARVLIYLGSAAEKGGGFVAAGISKATGIAPSKLSAAVQGLQTKRLVEVDAERIIDRRRKPLRLTASARARLGELHSSIGVAGFAVSGLLRMTTGRSPGVEKARDKLLSVLREPRLHGMWTPE